MATDVIARGMASSASAEGGEDTVARAEIAAIKDGETLDSFGDVETALADKADITDIPTVPITAIQKNGTGITPVSGTVNITVPTTAAEVSALPDTTKYAASLSLEINASTFVVTGQLKDQNGDNLGNAQTIDLPLESVVVGGSYDDTTKKVVLSLQNGNTVEFSVADLVAGLQTELSATNKLNPAYINYDSTHRAVSDTEKSTWNDKQNALTTAQLAAVNSGIESTKVAQIETNKNNISKDEAALVEIVDGGAKNDLEFNYISSGTAAGGGTTWTTNGVTFTLNPDNSITVNRVSSSESDAVCQLYLDSSKIYIDSLCDNNHVLSGCPDGGSDTTFFIGAHRGSYAMKDTGEGAVLLPTTQANVYLQITIMATYSPNNLVFKPMICSKAAWDISHAYQPYRPSYQELYERIVTLEQANQ